MNNTMVTVTVEYAMEYDGEVTEEDIDLNDIIKDSNAITNIKVKTWGMSFYDKYLRWRTERVKS